MKVVDANLLLYAVNRDSAHHERARSWLERSLSADEPIAFPWVVILAFLRIATHGRIFPEPLDPEQALSVVDGWLARHPARVLHPGDDHWRLLKDLVDDVGTAGNLTTDAHLAALAIEHGAVLVSTDSDFARFPHLRWENPLDVDAGTD